MKIMVSACLLGKRCKYSGGDNRNEAVISFLKDKEYVAVCPEVAAGMPVPRPPVEIRKGRVISIEGKDLDEIYREGVRKTLEEAGPVDMAILKGGSPTCGVHQIYDGTFSGTKIRGMGILASALAAKGIPLYDEKDIEKRNGEI
ncbi:DUF523 domain-containing protein [uncultured Dialister sp.]|uniref:DUF523 domain-containing protein n=1 Tax=uncultured Dialister sp. TaxID=278064 RepID=UPI0025E37B2F|nr:DUF523 domain-containing protein [uncultured Dialister sp.]